MPEFGDPISERELDVLNCLAEGASNREIAQELSISHNTVKVHVRNIFAKLGVSSRTEATTVALQKGVLNMPGIEVEPEEGDGAEPAEREAADGEEQGTGRLSEEGQEDRVEAGSPQNGPDGVAAHSRGAEGAPVIPPVPVPAGRALRPLNRRLLFLGGLVAIVALAMLALTVDEFQGRTTTPPSPTATAPLFAETELDDNWLLSRPLPEPRSHMVVTTIGLNLYAIGGETPSGVDNGVLIYDTQRRAWLPPAAPKLTAVADAAAAVLAGEIYVMGGRLANGQPSTAVEAYSPLNDGWRPVAALPRAVSGSVALTNGSNLYLLGGHDGQQAVADALLYDAATQQWQPLPPMQQARAFAAGGVIDGKLYIAGGSDGEQALSSCEFFDPLTTEWSSCPDLLQARMGAGAAVFLNKLYLLGGTAEEEVGYSEVYDAANQEWAQISTPALDEIPDWSYVGVTNIETRIYALGGSQNGELSDRMYVYRPLTYQFFIPAASAPDN